MIPEVVGQFESKHTGVLATTVDQPYWEPDCAYVFLTNVQGTQATNDHQVGQIKRSRRCFEVI